MWEVPARGGKTRQVLAGWKGSRGEWNGQWTADGMYYVFIAIREGENGRNDLWALREPPRFFPWLHPSPVRLTSGPIGYGDPLPSRDPRILYARSGAEQFDWVNVDESSRVAKPFLQESNAREVSFSPDGESVLFVTANSLWRSKRDGSERFQLVENLDLSPVHFPRWSPDSKRIVFEGTKDGSGPIYKMSSQGGIRESILAPGGQVSSPDWGPGGERIVFSQLEPKTDHFGSQPALYFHEFGSE